MLSLERSVYQSSFDFLHFIDIYFITQEIQIVGIAFNLIIIRAATLSKRKETVLPGSLSFMRSPPLHDRHTAQQDQATSDTKTEMDSSNSLPWDTTYTP